MAFELRNCPKCGKVFSYMSNSICKECEKAEEDQFNKVRDYLNENPMCNMQVLSDETGVSMKKIMQYLRDGRLQISKGMVGELLCDDCGKPILSGRYCDTCIIKLNQHVEDLFHPRHDGERSGKMHTRKRL